MSTAHDEHLFNDGENYRQRTLPHKQFNSERKHNIRKHALGEIKNVIHNHASTTTTPFKGLQAPGPSRNFHLKFQVDIQQKTKFQSNVTNNSEELQKRELPTIRTCNKNCHKGLEEIWSEMNVLEPDVLERLINGDGDIENDFDLPDRNLAPIDFDDALDLAFDVHDTYELESNKLLEKFLAEDCARDDFPLAIDW